MTRQPRVRTLDESRSLFLAKAGEIQDQQHFDACMELFPDEVRAEMYAAVQSLLKKPFTLKPRET